LANGVPVGEFIVVRFDALPYPHAREACKRCGNQTGYLAKLITTRNRVELRLCCEVCEKTDSTLNLPREPFGITDLGVLPTINQAKFDYPGNCWICDEQADDWNHWAPRAIFPDWPDSHSLPMCVECHEEWHRRLRAHGLRYPHELEQR